MWEILDENGTIHSGSEKEMKHAYDVMTQGTYLYDDDEIKKWCLPDQDGRWTGDLKLIQIHEITH